MEKVGQMKKEEDAARGTSNLNHMGATKRSGGRNGLLGNMKSHGITWFNFGNDHMKGFSQ
jgi:hypothetical protein